MSRWWDKFDAFMADRAISAGLRALGLMALVVAMAVIGIAVFAGVVGLLVLIGQFVPAWLVVALSIATFVWFVLSMMIRGGSEQI